MASTIEAERYAKQLSEGLSLDDPHCADVLVIFGGDGFMLRSLHQFQSLGKPVYGINCGTVGFLMNQANISSGDELLDITGEDALSLEDANKVIMAARAHWFEAENA